MIKTYGENRNCSNKAEYNDNYQTLKSTFIMGGSSILNIAFGIVRHKVIALLLGSSGMGLLSLYQSISSLTLTIFGLGINESGARQVAISFRDEDRACISRTSLSLRRTALVTGVVGMAILSISSKYVSLLTFKNTSHSFDIVLLSLTVLFGTIFGGQTALIQGARKIPYLAKISVLGPLWGTILSLPLIYLMGMRGVVSYLIVLSATNVISSWWYSRKIRLPAISTNWHSSIKEAKSLVGLGTALMLGTIFGVASSFIIRIVIVRDLGLGAVGVFQASTILSSVYAGILFKAMATDYYPRLSAASASSNECSQLVNQQVEAGLLLAVPGVLFTLTFASLVIVILYSKEFLPAVDVLRWQVLGVLLQIITWPMGYILRARAAGKLFIATEFYSYCCYLAATWVGIKMFGLPGIGVAYFTYNVLYLVLIYPIVHSKYGFTFNRENTRLLILASLIVTSALLATYALPSQHIFINIPIVIASAYYSYKKLNFSELLSRFIKKFKTARLTNSESKKRC
ncbi:MAG: O-antigen translocase [Candidatus Atribacteria bacterium]|nr:O-antigen translocase [Candidatus Atribacteria bacterium]